MDNWRTYSGHFTNMGTVGGQILHFWTSMYSVGPLGTLENMSENLFLGSTQALSMPGHACENYKQIITYCVIDVGACTNGFLIQMCKNTTQKIFTYFLSFRCCFFHLLLCFHEYIGSSIVRDVFVNASTKKRTKN